MCNKGSVRIDELIHAEPPSRSLFMYVYIYMYIYIMYAQTMVIIKANLSPINEMVSSSQYLLSVITSVFSGQSTKGLVVM